MRRFGALASAALLLAGCETAFVGKAPGGRYQLVEVNGRAPPTVTNPGHHCPVSIAAGSFDLDPIARRFDMSLDRSGPCRGISGAVDERGSYLRRGGRLELEGVPDGGGVPRALVATESGDTVTMNYDGVRLRFRKLTQPR